MCNRNIKIVINKVISECSKIPVFKKKKILGHENVQGTFHSIILQTLWERFETISNINRSKTFQKID